MEKDKESNLYIGVVPNLPGAHTQARTLDELHVNLKEVIELCLEEMITKEIEDLPEFIGVQHFSVSL
ncbi:type II toxin-antitoxin system HicB family antitoxin [Aquiflexum sp.]|uniref:type II toxin-antitoxin system HicB family antitoxin n=1 Tax=Aquiflexum sp. TaxID=1872584 RepID=UPI0035942920